MKLWDIHYTDGDHEPEHALFAHGDQPRPNTADAKEYLLSVEGLIGKPEALTIEGVYPFQTAYDLSGNPYKIKVLA